MPKISALPAGTQLASADAFPFLSRLSNVTERVSLDTLQSAIANSPQVSQLISAGAQPLSVVVNVKDPRFGAVGIGAAGAALDTAAIIAAYTYAQAQAFAGIFPTSVPIITAVLYFPPGDYFFNGPSLNYLSNSAVYLRGAGRQQTRIQIAAGIYLVDTDKLIYSTDVRGIHFNGGKGVLRYSGTATNTQGTHVVEDCYFGNYTECAIGNDATDMPFWKIRRNIFLGTITSKGICLSGLPNSSTIEHNSFQYNLIHVQIGTNGTGALINDNNFFRNFANIGTPITDIWLVPGSATVGLSGVQVIHNELDGDNLDVGDYRILIADEDTATGTDHITYKPKLSASTNWAGPLKVKDNRVAGSGASPRALITSWTKLLTGLEARNDFFGTPIQTLVFGAGVNVPGNTQSALLNTFEASSVGGGAADILLPEPVVPFSGVFDDPNSLYQGYSSVHSPWGSGSDPSYLDLTSTLLSAFTIVNGSGASVADSIGGNTAFEFTATSSGFAAFGQFLAPTASRVAFIEFDLKQGSSLPIPTLIVRISNNGNLSDVAAGRLIAIPPYWKRIRIPFSLPSLASTYNLASFQIQGFSAGATKFQIGRFRVYHAHEPIHPGATYLEASTPYKPPILGSNMGTTAIVALIGAMPLDYATAAFSLDLQNLQITAAAGSNAVNVRFQNGIGPSVNLGSGTLACRVFKFLQNG